MTPPAVSKAAAERLAKGIEVGNFVLYGERTLKMRVPIEDTITGTRYARTHLRCMGEVVEVTPTGRLRVRFCGDRGDWKPVLLSAKDSLKAEVMTPGMIARRKTMLFGWE